MTGPSILWLGLPWDDPAIPPHIDRNQIKAGITATEDEARAAGYDFETLCSSAKDGVQECQEALQKKKYDAVIIGFGVRGNPNLTEYFENLINLIATFSPHTKMGFNSNPATTVEAVQRVAPFVKE